MEEDSETQNTPVDTSKRPNPPDEEAQTPPKKKVRLGFSVKEFRKQLKSNQQTQALQGFLQLISEDSKQDHILTYLEHGGSALEILQLMEGDSGASPVLIFDIVNRILLQINAKLRNYQNAAYDSCRYLLNTYITLINRMVGLSSSTKERLVTLRLLTTIVTFSVVLAKDVLLHVNFNPTNLEVLTKVSEDKSEVREAFIHFITAFLVGGHFPTLSVLLEKKGLMTCIINGLKFDKVDVVVLVLTAMKNHILENSSVSKTLKMKTFNTLVVKDIVNLYNWKGPAGITDAKKKTKVATVNEIDKSKVSEAVHSFLLVLCTSHKFGVIFRDPLLGLGKRQNSLMLTVLQSLERPWEHSYAGELVSKICKACPDLARMMWMHLKQFLEPRWTVKWLNSMKFATMLLEDLQPDCIEFCVNNLNVHQVIQIITTLTAPLPVLKILIPETRTFDQPAVKHHVMSLFLKMAQSFENYLDRSKTWPNIDTEILSASIANHIYKNFPDVQLILENWDSSDEDSSVADYLETALDLLGKYKTLAPKVLEESSPNFDITEFITKLETVIEETHLRRLQVKAVNFFIDLEPSHFRPKSDLFKTAFSFSLEFYYNFKSVEVLEVLRRLLNNSGVFDGFSSEVDFWIDGILNLKHYDENVALMLCDLVKRVDENAEGYNKKLFEFEGANFSPLLLGLGDLLGEIEPPKCTKNYLNFVIFNFFHSQNDSGPFYDTVSKLDHFSDDLRHYIESWRNSEVTPSPKCKGKLMERFHKFSNEFLENNFENFDCEFYPNFKLNLLQTLIFYLTNLVKTNQLSDNQVENCSKFVTYLISENAFVDDRYVKTILGNPTLLSNFTLFDSKDFSTRFVLNVLKELNSSCTESFIVDFRKKVVSTLSKIFRKPQKFENADISIEIIEAVALNYDQCHKLLNLFVSTYENKRFYHVACYCLDRMSALAKKDFNLEPLSNEIVTEISNFLMILITDQDAHLSSLSSSFLNYLKVFPHSVESVKIELFDSLVTMSEYNINNLSLCRFLLERKPESISKFEENLDEICSKRSFLLSLLDVIVAQNGAKDAMLAAVFTKMESHIVKALQKPHKAGQHFQNRYRSVAVLVEKFMKLDAFGTQIQKFETTELFHVFLLRKIFDKVDKNDKILGNMIMTFIHLMVSLIKQKGGSKPVENFNEIGEVFFEFLHQISKENFDVAFLSANETFKMFCKLCLKHGVGGEAVLIKILTELVEFCVVEEDGKLILEMLLSHSLFLDVVLGDSKKEDLLRLWETVCLKWPQFMERSHVPVLLSAYRATKSDATTLRLLKMYESKPEQTKFFDFKPFLWGRAAASHYSVRSDILKVLWRQPKMADVLNNLHQNTILATITDPNHPDSYDLDYFLPLFSHLLSPENPVATYRFSKTGALSLTLTGLRGDKTQRLATCHVLQRFYFHLEARQGGKDNPLWLRFIEAICKGLVVLDDFKINNFVGVFLARMALILTQPTHVMYLPLSQYLTAKDALDFGGIPELYTFLHSPHVNSKDHKHFILEVLRDGLRNEGDFTTLLRSMGFKLISELCSSTVCDLETKALILEVFEKCCAIGLGVKVLCGSLSFLTQVASLVVRNVRQEAVLRKLLDVLLRIVEVDGERHRNFVVYLSLITLCEDEYFGCLVGCKGLDVYYRILAVVVERFTDFFSQGHMDSLLEKSRDPFCKYMMRYGCRFVRETDFLDCNYYLRLLFYNKLKLKN